MRLVGLSVPLLVAVALALPADAQNRRRQKREAQPPAAAAPAQPLPSVKAGVQLWQREQWAAAVTMWRPFAEAGDPDAMFNMGQALKLGRGVPRDEEQARAWFRRAAEKGHRPAQANLGILLFQLQEKPEALRWLKEAADAGEPRGQYVYGVALWNGDGVPRNLSFAYAYLARAADQGLEEARSALDRLTPMLKPVERANGWAMAAAMRRGDGMVVPLTSIAAPDDVAAPAPVPQTPTVSPATLPLATGPVFRIQIGAYSRRELADAAMAALRQNSPALLTGLSPHYEPGRGLVRLQLGPFASRDLATSACQRFQAAGRACLVVDAG
jgi:TPR repeat protein